MPTNASLVTRILTPFAPLPSSTAPSQILLGSMMDKYFKMDQTGTVYRQPWGPGTSARSCCAIA